MASKSIPAPLLAYYQENIAVSLVAIMGGLLVLASVCNSRRMRNCKPTNGKSLPSLPPAGPSLFEFLSYMKAQNQEAANIKYGDFFTVPSPLPGIIPTQVWINDPAVVKYLTVACANMYRPPSTFTTRDENFQYATQTVVGVGVTGLVGEEWRWRKTALLKSFRKSNMISDGRGLLGKIVEEGEVLCDALGKAADRDEVVAVDLLCTKAAVGVVLYFLFGRDLEFDPEKLRDAAGTLMECLGYMFMTPLFRLRRRIPGTEPYRMHQQKLEAWRVTDSVVAAEIQRLLDEHSGVVQVHPDRKPGSVMEMLIANEPRFREGGVESMIAEARVFVQAGFETTAHSLAFSMGMMAERPDLADKMSALGQNLLKGDYYNVEKVRQAVDGASIVKNFFLESVRLYPLAPALGGLCKDDIVIRTGKVNGAMEYMLPKGTSVFFPNLLLQRHVERPDEIDPSRWEVESKGDEPFLHTFQNGAHACPGKPLSMLEGHVFLLLAVTQFEFFFADSTVTTVQYEDNLLLRPKDGMPLRVKRRKALS
mmetsp:Transcript_49535/g.105247  ORF Transcript_49535/g.105247 Transcript_49535/m.105247 type:complete len:535 (+) Transcript_49535:185-1789(+)|eukprot:CAMPEP_0172540782 /NCGR_PEP_ID=MMETSP1067-20121228/11711_1 /TAXON_ID=265564 ORGANISM="Thalassiosira punctigera, Strain Tpunct2005C2" /NCGR_SAMPLE_ID=MMETSP1067 /ASSEMBLY_ACC=CAM_ASM_000444 /LENGTH=534 /DNA_ID=CAMNT_0013326695 /DNA_START=183 /DNA_END=1787 /DNA_ORIENTATION=-